MIAVIARLHVAEGSEVAFEEVMGNLIDQVRANEPGNHLYTMCRDEDGNYVMLELYDTAEDIDDHGRSEHFKAAGAGFRGLMSGAPEIQRLEVIKG